MPPLYTIYYNYTNLSYDPDPLMVNLATDGFDNEYSNIVKQIALPHHARQLFRAHNNTQIKSTSYVFSFARPLSLQIIKLLLIQHAYFSQQRTMT